MESICWCSPILPHYHPLYTVFHLTQSDAIQRLSTSPSEWSSFALLISEEQQGPCANCISPLRTGMNWSYSQHHGNDHSEGDVG